MVLPSYSLDCRVPPSVHLQKLRVWDDGPKLEQAFFVRSDQSAVTQNDLENDRLVCLVGVALVRPAEFVIFQIVQNTRAPDA
jgi:phage tail sheath protein FI